MRLALWISLALALGACTPQAVAPVQAPPVQAPAAERTAAPSAWKRVETTKQRIPLVPEPSGVPAPDASCQAYVAHPVQGCNTGGSDPAALALALEMEQPLERDERLACLENSSQFKPGLIHALRAELAPLTCADTLAIQLLEPRRPELDRTLEDTLIALAAAGRLSRLVQQTPELLPPFDKEHFRAFFQGTLKPWIVTQAAAIHDLSAIGPRLSPYAKGVVAVEAGLADMRFVSVVRQVTLPREMSDDAEIRDAYYAALDEALEPRKVRGRDAALVGLQELAEQGVLVDPRVERARALLSQVYSGRRIDALDRLLLPALKPVSFETTEQRLAARLPSFYAGFMLADAVLDAPLLRALLERGVPRTLATRLDPAKIDEASYDLLLRAYLERGRRYFRGEDFAACLRLNARAKSPERDFYLALASALQSGPHDPTQLLLAGPRAWNGILRVDELDRLAVQKGNANAPLAAFDAAYLLGLVPPQNDPKFWTAQAIRFDHAARALQDGGPKRFARESSAAARDTANALKAALAAKASAGH